MEIMNLFQTKPKKFNGYIMNASQVVAKVKNSQVYDIKDNAPLWFRVGKDFESWIRSRSIDTHRTNSRLLRKMLRLKGDVELEFVFRAHGATITDSFWVKEENERLDYFHDIRFTSDKLSDLALKGKTDLVYGEYEHSPELTNIGSYEKAWRRVGEEWYLLKQGSVSEIFSELFVYLLGNELGYPMAEYGVEGDYIVSRNFLGMLSDDNFEPMYSLLGDNDDYEDNILALSKFGESVVEQYLQMIFMDLLVRNPDRHTYNYGLVTNSHTGEVISMAPNFDNNLSFIAGGIPQSTNRNDIQDVSFLSDFEIPEINYIIVREVIVEVLSMLDKNNWSNVKLVEYNEFMKNIDIDYLVEFIMNGYDKIVKGIVY